MFTGVQSQAIQGREPGTSEKGSNPQPGDLVTAKSERGLDNEAGAAKVTEPAWRGVSHFHVSMKMSK